MQVFTCTLNPSLDQLCQCDLHLYELNILEDLVSQPAGKGINVSRILKEFSIPSSLFGFLGGSNGQAILYGLQDPAFDCRFIEVNGNTRSNMKIYHDSKCTELNQSGPVISQKEQDLLLEQLDILKPGDLFICSGSCPQGIAQDYLYQLVKKAKEKEAIVLLDSSGERFLKALNAHPDYIKPNDLELKELYPDQFPEENDPQYLSKICMLARKMIKEYGLQGILCSMGKQGACMISENDAYYAPSIKLEKAYATGAGDSMVAAMSSVLYESKDKKMDSSELDQKILKRAIAFASACCMNPKDILFSPELAEELEEKVHVQRI